MSSEILNFLSTRKSAPIAEMTGPAPSDSELNQMLQIATRVPDHGRLAPWRFILYRGDAREKVGLALAELAEKREGPLSEKRREQELTRFSRAPLVIGVVSKEIDNPKIPQWERMISGGIAAYNFCLAANALGYASNWITNWYSDLPEGRAILGVNEGERVIGFLHIGRHSGDVAERPRPPLDNLISDYSGPIGS